MFYIDDVKLCCVLCMWKENRCKDHSVIDFIWDFTKQRGTLSCWCEEVLYWFLWSAVMKQTRRLKKPLRTFKEARARKLVEERGKRGREGKSSRVSEMKVRRHRRRNWSSWEKHVNTAECQTKMISKGRSAAAKQLELNRVFSMEEDQWKAVKKFHVMVMMELWWHTSRLCGTVMGGRLSLAKKLFNGVSFPNKHLN